jgi:hypothetical protein
MPTRQEYAAQVLWERLVRLVRTPDQVQAAIAGRTDAQLSQKPDARGWAPKEVVCHLTDIEEQFILRFRSILALDTPTVLTLGDMPPDAERCGVLPGERPPLDPDRWAVERQHHQRRGDERYRPGAVAG